MIEPEAATRSRWGPTTRQVIKLALLGLVLVFVTRHIIQTDRDLRARNLPLSVHPAWLVGAGGLYLLGMIAYGVYFQRILARSPTPVGFYAAIRAYLVSHLAKYVPGKAMVVVVRSGLVAEAGARPATAAFATLYETLVMMAAGGLLAAAGFLWTPRQASPGVMAPIDAEPPPPEWPAWVPLVLLSLAAGLGFLILVWPRIFPLLAGLIRKPLQGIGADAVPRLSVPLLGEGLLWGALGWICLGLSQVAVLAGVEVGNPTGSVLNWQLWPVVIASVALATVAGFAVLIAPGGLGVREYVLWSALDMAVTNDEAVVGALVLRLVWVATEVVVAAALYWVRPWPRVPR